MRILMLGNSFIFVNNLPAALARLTGAEVVHHTRGGARLAEHLNPGTKMGSLTQTALQNEKWDYVVLQEMSNGPITSKKSFLKNVGLLCEQIRGERGHSGFVCHLGDISGAGSSWSLSEWIMMKCTGRCMSPVTKRRKRIMR